MKTSTEVVQRAHGLIKAEPLTTPIFETTTFVFDNAQQVCDYNEGKSEKYLVHALRQSDGHRCRGEGCETRRSRGGDGAVERTGRHDDRITRVAEVRGRDSVQFRGLRRNPAPDRRPSHQIRDRRPVRVDRGVAISGPALHCSDTNSSGSNRRSFPRCGASTSARRVRLPRRTAGSR